MKEEKVVSQLFDRLIQLFTASNMWICLKTELCEYLSLTNKNSFLSQLFHFTFFSVPQITCILPDNKFFPVPSYKEHACACIYFSRPHYLIMLYELEF